MKEQLFALEPINLGGELMEEMEPLERRIQILKLLQGKEMRTSEIAEYFNKDERTIRADIQELRDGLDVLGTKFKIESKHDGDQKHYYKSTVHPIILALNSSELFALLKLLENSKKQSRDVYEHIFNEVYSQITDYADKLIAHKLNEKYDKSNILNRLEEEAFKNSNDYKLVYWEKSSRLIEISYLDVNDNSVTEKVRLLDIKDNNLNIQNEHGKTRWVNYNDILIDWDSVSYK